MEQNLEHNNIIPQNGVSEDYEFISDEQDKFSELPIDSNETKFIYKIPPPPNENDTEAYLDILGSGDLLKRILKKSNSECRPMKDEQILISFVGRIEGKDDIIEEAEKLEITLGCCDVIQGIDVALSLMYIDEVAELKIPPRFGYGKLGLEPKVPAEARLVYIVELIAVRPVLVPENMIPFERLKIGQQKKVRGNWCFKRNENVSALLLYRKALHFLGEKEEKIGSELEQHEIRSERIKTLNNIAIVHISMQNLNLALETLNSVLAIEPMNEKAIMRKGKVLSLKGQYMAATRELNKALQINPKNKEVQTMLKNIKIALVKEKTQEKELYKKMLGQKGNGEKPSKDAKMNSTFLISGFIAGLAVICGYCYLNNNFPFNKFSTL